MKNCIIAAGIFLLATMFLLTACDKKDDYSSEPLSDYMDMQVGKYIIYRLDSTVFVNFGQKDTIITWLAKDVVDAAITDNLGRPGFRVVRYLRDTSSTNDDDWRPTISFQVTPTREQIELNENNFRFVKLKLPIREGYDWRGNSYLPSNPYKDLYPFSNDEDMQEWEYQYQDVGASLEINNKTYDNTLSVFQIADSVNVPIVFPDGIGYRNYWIEKYAKGIGLVYREMVMWEYQPQAGTNPSYRHGFGLKMTILDHN